MSTTAPSSNSPESSAAIDSRRAQQLMERALVVAERGDLQGAVVACRQSLALAPNSPQAYSMLGLLLERAGDAQGAIKAYERVLQLAPDSVLERESLGRLRGTVQQNRTARSLFNFDDGELFGDERPAHPAVVKTGSTPETAKAAAAATPPTKPPTPGNGVSAAAAVAADSAAIASMASARAAAQRAAAAPAPVATAVPAIPPLQNGRLPRVAPAIEEYREETLWEKLLRRPTYFFRGAPLIAMTVASLLLLLWAHQFAISRAQTELPPLAPTPAASTTAAVVPAEDNAQAANSATSANAVNEATDAAENAADATTGEEVTPTTAASPRAAPAPPAANTTAAPAPAPPRSPAAPRTAPRPPAPAPPANNDDNSNFPAMPPPRITPPSAPEDRVRIAPPSAPSDSGGISKGGTPHNPGGGGDGYIRVQPTSSTFRAPARPENLAVGNERAGTRSGNSVTAIALLSRSIESGGSDAAFRHQQRAQIYLQSGDRARAVADFQAAINGYREMIARGERVAFARSGIQASQRGIQLAVGRT